MNYPPPPPSKTQYSSTLDYIHSNNSTESTSSGDTNKLKLFGFEFEFDPNPPGPTGNHQNHSPAAEADESVNSSNTVQMVNSAARPDRTTPSSKLRCDYCMKEFGNSQALGGHQNAHKKERMKKKRLQLQARRATTISSFYLHVPNPTRWFYDPAASLCDDVINYNNNNNNSHEFTVYEEIPMQVSGRQISFNDHPDCFSVPASFQLDDTAHWDHHGGGFTLTHHRPVVGGGGRRSGKAAAAAAGSTGRADLDLQLGLRLQ